jgi:ATP-binding cassette, subfamily A (ABC1), member 3
MEEADHLADRVGVLAKRMLDIGTTSHLREKHGHGFHIQLICKSAPHTPDSETDAVKKWIETTIPGAELEGFAYHGQMRYNIHSQSHILTDADVDESGISGPSNEKDEMSVGKLFVLLEENKDKLGLEYYSVSPSTFDEVFLRVVGKHGVQEEDAPAIKKDWKYHVRTVLKTVAPFFVI